MSAEIPTMSPGPTTPTSARRPLSVIDKRRHAGKDHINVLGVFVLRVDVRATFDFKHSRGIGDLADLILRQPRQPPQPIEQMLPGTR